MKEEEKELICLPFTGYVKEHFSLWKLPRSVDKWSPYTVSYFAQKCGQHMYDRQSPKLLVGIIEEMFRTKQFGEVEKMFLERIGHYCYLGYWELEKERLNRPSFKIEVFQSPKKD